MQDPGTPLNSETPKRLSSTPKGNLPEAVRARTEFPHTGGFFFREHARERDREGHGRRPSEKADHKRAVACWGGGRCDTQQKASVEL